jgi:phosphoenolpyruvate carboxylase
VLLDTVESLVAAREIQAAGGSRALHRYIISNTRGAANILEVLFLARIAGYAAGSIDLDVVPLFETVQDLSAAHAIMNRLYDLPLYRQHLASRGNRQHIMLGFSDGTKDGGYMTANWLIYRTRRVLSEAAAENGITLIFFEGRGGPPARGGGKTHQFYRGMSRATAGEEIHLTIQGQTISSNFGTPAAARYNLEQLVTAGLETRILPEDFQELTEEQRDLLEELSRDSLQVYRQLKERPDFLPYLEEMTPLVYYGQANNASRPTSRSSGGKLRLEDLRAIPFVGAWSQMKQNIPGYFGFGSALERAIGAGKRDDLRRLFRDHLFFRTLVENSMQSLSKVNFSLTRFLAEDERFADVWKTLEEEMLRTRKLLLEVASAEQLLPGDAAIRESIALRETIVFPVLVIQQYALAKLRENDLPESEREANRKLVVKSMAAIVNAGRNAV